MKVICQHSQKCWDYFLKKKNKVCKTIKHLIDILEAGGWKVQYVRCDGAGEYLEVKVMLEKRGINIKFTRANMPERNGFVERCFLANREKATAAMIFAKLQPELRHILWAQFAKASSIITNQTCNMVHEVPQDELFYQKQCKLRDNIQILGRVRYLPNQSKIKTAKFVTNKAKKIIMCGFIENHTRDTY